MARSLELGPGDEVLGTDHEYGALDRTWRFLARERGFTYINQPMPVPVTSTDAFVNSLCEGVTPHTRVIFLSHITSPTALIFPVEAVIKRARQSGIISVVDGARPLANPLAAPAGSAGRWCGDLDRRADSRAVCHAHSRLQRSHPGGNANPPSKVRYTVAAGAGLDSHRERDDLAGGPWTSFPASLRPHRTMV